MVAVVLIFWLAGFVAVGTLIGAVVGIRRDVGRIADVLQRIEERDRAT
jgi:hypothetical protein